MSFSKNAIGFYLELQDTLSPKLAAADKNYDKFVKHITKLNTQAFAGTKKGLGDIGKMAEQYAAQSAKAFSAISKTKRAPQMPVDLVITAKSKKALKSVLSEALGSVFSKATLRLSASAPRSRSSLFDQSSSLRAQYRGMSQPPDMAGTMNIPKFNKGGMVGGPDGIDKVLAMLTKGEMVLPKDAAKTLQDIAGAAFNEKGKFTAFPTALAEAYARAESLLKVAPKLKSAIATGLDPQAPQKFLMVQQELERLQKQLISGTDGLATNYKGRLAPALEGISDRMKEVGKEVVKVDTRMSKWMKSITSSTAFLAAHTALKTLQEDFLQVHSAAGELSQAAGIDSAVKGLVTNFYEMNKVLHLAPDELSKMRSEFIKVSEEIPLAFRDLDHLSTAMNSLVSSGIDKDIAMKLAGPIHLFSSSTGAAVEDTKNLALVLNKQLKMSAGAAADSLSNFQKIAAGAGVDAGMLTTNVLEAAKSGELFLSTLSPAQAGKALESVARLTAAFEKAAPGSGEQIASGLFGALDDPAKLSGLAGAFGQSVEGFKAKLTSGDLDGFFKQMNLAGPYAAKATADMLGVSETAIRLLATNSAEMNDSLGRTAKAATLAGKGQADLAAATKDTSTWFSQAAAAVKNFVQNTGPMPDIIAFLGELNPLALLSATYLGGKLLPAAIGLFSTLKGGAGLVGNLSKGLFFIMNPVKLAVSAFGMFRNAVAAVQLAFWALRLAMIANPIGAIITGLTLAAAAVWYFWEPLKAMVSWVGDKLMVAFNGWYSLVSAIFVGLKDIGSALLNWDMDALWNSVKRFGTAIMDFVLSPINAMLATFGVKPIKIDMGGGMQVSTPEPVKDISAGSMLSPQRVDAMQAQVAARNGDNSVLSEIRDQLREQTKVMKQDTPATPQAPSVIPPSRDNQFLRSMAIGQMGF